MRRVLPVVLTIFIACCTAASAQEAGVRIEGAWARSTPPGAKTAAAYMTIVSPQADRLLSVATPVAGEADVHKTTNDNGVMKMSPAGALDIKPNQPVVLGPSGLHLMMMDLKQPLTDGQSFPLTLVFEKAGKVEVTVPVRRTAPAGAAAMPGMAAPVIVSPKDGETVTSPVTVVIDLPNGDHQIGGMSGMAHDHGKSGGHVHLLVDAPPPKAGARVPADKQHIHLMGAPKTSVSLSPGKHTLQAVMGTMDHKATDAPPSAVVTITVK